MKVDAKSRHKISDERVVMPSLDLATKYGIYRELSQSKGQSSRSRDQHYRIPIKYSRVADG